MIVKEIELVCKAVILSKGIPGVVYGVNNFRDVERELCSLKDGCVRVI